MNQQELEVITLGSMLCDIKTCHKGVLELSDKYFNDINHRLIYNAICELVKRGEDIIDDINLSKALEFDMENPWAILNKITEIETPLHYKRTAKLLKDNFKKRTVVQGLRTALAELEDNGEEDSVRQAFSKIYEIEKEIADIVTDKTLIQSVKNVVKTVEDYHECPELNKIEAYDMLLPNLTQYFTGVRPGEFVAIGARPSVGKTSFMIQLARLWAKDKKHCAIFSLETPMDDLAELIITQELGKPFNRFYEFSTMFDTLKKQEKNSVYNYLHCYDSKFHLNDIMQTARILKAQKNISVMFVDYMQLIKSDKSYSREREVAEISRDLRLFAIETGITVVVLCQLSREVEKDGRLPRMSDFRESGAIEQDATRVLFLCRPMKNKFGDSQDPEEYEGSQFHQLLLQRKCRKGPKDVNAWLHFDGPIQTFSLIETKEQEGKDFADSIPDFDKML